MMGPTPFTTVTIALGIGVGVGVLLIAACFLWPSRPAVSRPAPAFTVTLRERLTLAGMAGIPVRAVLTLCIIVAVLASVITFAFIPVTVLAVAAGMAAFTVPLAVVNWRAAARQRANQAVWPDVVDHLVSAVRSGLSLPDSVIALARTGPELTRPAFLQFEEDLRTTANFGDCLDRAKERLADPVADRILETLRMAREVGGTQLTTVLRDLSANLRQQAAIRSEVQARQSWVINAARLGVAAPWILLLLLATRPEAAAAYNSSAGVVMICAGLLVSVLAYRIMLALGRLPQEQRWFR